MYGIPSKCDFYKDDYQGLFLKQPLNQKNPEAKELTEQCFKKLDDKLNTEEFRENVGEARKTNTHTNR